jgi:dissimilatory sulfite reductase (desulfoviridin) alpha/beta subunit
MEWTEEALKKLKRVPFFIRGKVKKQVEDYLRAQGRQKVDLEGLLEAKRVLLNRMGEAEKAYEVSGCFGLDSCPNAITSSENLLIRIEELLKSEKVSEFLRHKVKGKLKAHHKFKVLLSECPNACSQIYIADVGICGFMKIEIEKGKCTGCGLCEAVCEEGAIFVKETAFIDQEKCLGCGDCLRACPEEAIKTIQKGYRVYLGGKLGRHPRLATYLTSCFSEDEVLEVLKKVLKVYKDLNLKGERLGGIIQRIGWEEFKKKISS